MDYEGLWVELMFFVEQLFEVMFFVVISFQSVFVVDGVGEMFVGDVEQGYVWGFIDVVGFCFNNVIFDLVVYIEVVMIVDGVGFQNEGDFIVVFFVIDGDGQVLFEGDCYFFSIDFDVWVLKFDIYDWVDGFDGDVQGFKFFGFVGGVLDVGVGGIGFFFGVVIRQVVGGKLGVYFVMVIEFSDEVFVELWFIDVQLWVGE